MRLRPNLWETKSDPSQDSSAYGDDLQMRHTGQAPRAQFQVAGALPADSTGVCNEGCRSVGIGESSDR